MTDQEPKARSLRDLQIRKADGCDVDEEQFRVLRRENELFRAAIAYPKALLPSGVVAGMFEGADYGVGWAAAISCEKLAPVAHGDALRVESVLSEMRRIDEKRYEGQRGDLWMAQATSPPPVDLAYAIDVLAKEMIARHQLRIWRSRTGKLNEQIDKTQDILGLHAEYLTEGLGITISHDGGQIGEGIDGMPWDATVAVNPNIVKTGFPQIDRAAGGGHGRGELGVVGGGTNHGKSYFAQRYLVNQAILRQNVLYISVEDSIDLMYCRMLSDFSTPKLRPVHIRERSADPAVVAAAMDSMKRGLEGRVRYWVKKKATVSEVCNAIRRHRFMCGIDSVVVDYLQAVQPDRTSNNKTQDTSLAVNDLKRCCDDVGVALWLLSQYSREQYKDGAEPDINACKYAGDIENESELIVLLFRDDEQRLHAKMPKVKWAQAQGLRYIIDTDEGGCLGEWRDDFEEPKKREERPKGGGGRGR